MTNTERRREFAEIAWEFNLLCFSDIPAKEVDIMLTSRNENGEKTTVTHRFDFYTPLERLDKKR